MPSPARVIFCIYLASAFVTAAEDQNPSAEDILALDGEALFEAADKVSFDAESKYPAADLLKITEKLATELKSVPKENEHRDAFDNFFKAACKQATDIDRLSRIYAKIEAPEYVKSMLLEPLANVWIKRELDTLRKEHLEAKLPEIEIALPDNLGNADPELGQAWRTYKRAVRAYDDAFPGISRDNAVSFQNNETAFYKVIDSVLLKHGEKLADRLLSFEWSGFCGTGSDSLYQPQSLGVFMALLRERRIPEAIGAAARVQEQFGGRFRIQSSYDPRVEFLQIFRSDWEEILAGGQIDAERTGSWLGESAPYVSELAAYGSKKGAALLAKMARHAATDLRAHYAYALGAFIEAKRAASPNADGVEEIVGSGEIIERVSHTEIPSRLQGELLQILQDFANPESSTEVAEASLRTFSRIREPKTIPTLRALLEHPSPKIVKIASAVLRSMGEDVEATVKADPVKFEIHVNGQPLAAASKVDWMVEFASESGSRSTSSSAEVDAKGLIGIDREMFLDPEKKPTGIFLNSPAAKTANEPWWGVPVSLPSNLDVITPVDVELCSVAVVLRLPKDRGVGQRASIRIQHERKEEQRYSYFNSMHRQFDSPADQPIALPPMQSGTYDLSISMPGAQRSDQKISVAPGVTSFDIPLQPGTDVHFEVKRPDRSKKFVNRVLLDNGKEVHPEFSYDTSTYRGLAPGNYVIHFLSTAEIRKRYLGENLQAGPDERDHEARDVAFTITDNSPAMIELGEIQLEASRK